MNTQRFPRKRHIENIDRTKLTELVFSDEDWKDFNRGIKLFNAGKFWHAHEAWEQVWRRHHEDSRLFIQGLIQMAAAFHLMIEKGRYLGATNNFNKALRNLRPFVPTFLNLPVSDYIAAIERANMEIQNLDKNELKEIDPALVPMIRFSKKIQK